GVASQLHVVKIAHLPVLGCAQLAYAHLKLRHAPGLEVLDPEGVIPRQQTLQCEGTYRTDLPVIQYEDIVDKESDPIVHADLDHVAGGREAQHALEPG